MRRPTVPTSARRPALLAALLGATLALAGCDRQAADAALPATSPGPRPTIGLLSTLPIYWPEGGALSALDPDAAPQPWVRTALAREGEVRPLDALDEGALDGIDLLVLAQPRMLTPAENVALDDWVRAGGDVLVFADPLLSGESAYPLGDPRRPQDVALLDPILARWGLDLLPPPHDATVRRVALGEGAILPVAAGGRLGLRPPAGGGEADCALSLEALLAQCRIRRGHVVVLADATLLERGFESNDSPRALSILLGMARDAGGDDAGRTGE